MASLGASALLVFVLPQNPMSQPWAMIFEKLCQPWQALLFYFIGQSLLAIPLAAALSILGMFILRCLYPPAAVALIAVLRYAVQYQYSLVMIDAVLLALAGAVYTNLTGKRYSKRPNKV